MKKVDFIFKVESTITAAEYKQFNVPATDILQAVKKANKIVSDVDATATVTKVELLPIKLLDDTNVV